MRSEQSKRFIRRAFEEIINKGNVAVIDELFATDFVDHSGDSDAPPGPARTKQAVIRYLAAFPDLHVTVEDVIFEGDKIVTRETWRGTHQGEFMGIAPTGKSILWTRMHIFRIRGGQIVEEWVESSSVLDQLG
jgi:predicted ester cyclase